MKKEVIYLAGGCFWGLEKYMEVIPGVVDVVSGYANGVWEEDRILTYEDVCTGLTGFRETVRVEFDSRKVSLAALLFSFFAAPVRAIRRILFWSPLLLWRFSL